MKVKNKECDIYGFKLKDIGVVKKKNLITITVLYQNYYTNEEAFFSINMDRASHAHDNNNISALKTAIAEKDIVEGFVYLLDAKGKNDTFEHLVSEFPESILLNHRNVVNDIIARYKRSSTDDDIAKAFSSRRKLLLDAMRTL